MLEVAIWDVEFSSLSERTLLELDTKVYQLCAIPVHLTVDDSNDIVRGAGDGLWLEPYRSIVVQKVRSQPVIQERHPAEADHRAAQLQV